MAYLYFSLYVILDLFSRYVVGWMVAAHESARLAERLIEAPCHKQGIAPKQLTIHADRGSGLRYLTPGDVHYGRAALILQVRHQPRLAASAAHPERFVQGPPRLEPLPEAVWINPPAKSTRQDAPGAALVTPDDPQHRVMFGSHVIVGHRPIVLVNSVKSLHYMRNQVVSKSLTRPESRHRARPPPRGRTDARSSPRHHSA